MRSRRTLAALTVLVVGAALACDEENIFRNTPPEVRTGSSLVWELALAGFPSGFDIPLGERLFVGTGPTSSTIGTFAVEARPDGTLVFVPWAVVVSGLSNVRTGIQDLSAGGSSPSFEAVTEVPERGYASPDDADGVPIVEGHVYAFQISRPLGTVVATNYAKLEVQDVGLEVPSDPDSRSVRFRWAYQVQPLNRSVTAIE